MDLLSLKTAFYPCCGKDIEIPLRILNKFVERVIFCDIKDDIFKRFKINTNKSNNIFKNTRFITGGVQEVIKCLQRIDVLFYRCDSEGEGGSNLKVLGNDFLQMVLGRMPLEGGLIITDGSNSRQRNFEKMTRHNGLIKFGWHMEPHPTTPTIRPPDGRSYCKDGLLRVIQVNPIIGEKGPPPHFDLRAIYF
jgi:hypothetical protein